MKIFFFEGVIGCGKSSILSELKDEYHVMLEPVSEWRGNISVSPQINLLEQFYKDPKKHSFNFQMHVLFSKFNLLTQSLLSGHDLVFAERSHRSDKIFATYAYNRGYISDEEWFTYNVMLKKYENLLSMCDPKYILVKVSPSTAIDRILQRDRKEENTISLEYMLDLDRSHTDEFKCDFSVDNNGNFEDCMLNIKHIIQQY